MSIIQNIFSVKNDDIRKVITILGLRIAFKSKKLIQRKLLNEKQKTLDLISIKLDNFIQFLDCTKEEPDNLTKEKTKIMNNELYDEDFYNDQASESYNSAQIVIDILKQYYKPTSVLDIGCGIGTWLKAWKDIGVENIQGIDANELPNDKLYIPKDNIMTFDFEKSDKITNLPKYDLSMTLECLEHISTEQCSNIVNILVKSSDIILFSSAIPYQPGTNHINCRRLNYWVEIFKNKGYKCYDIIRPECIRLGLPVMSWYMQNILVFAKNEKAIIIEQNGAVPVENPVMFYHCEMLRDILSEFVVDGETLTKS